ncbi:protein of unknown function [Cupriavidus neocaledonicus]|uniref:Uncharacterized protein n=1 Tax=Cupriavidus neocaledonicus TaxID=1040979 RepID=A0A375H6U6_9BURK|nr:hypothetical protein CBM2605_A140143 [Cupriavidus neocaledonicus]SPD46606.1 protein of unknown function [Cupriavidus neocaledonicus]
MAALPWNAGIPRWKLTVESREDVPPDFSSLGGQAESQCGLAHGRNAIGGLHFAQAACGVLGRRGVCIRFFSPLIAKQTLERMDPGESNGHELGRPARLRLAGPANPMPLLCRPVPGILFAVQVATRCRQRTVAKVVAHKAQVDLLVGHVRTSGVAKPVGRGAGQHRLEVSMPARASAAAARHAKRLFRVQPPDTVIVAEVSGCAFVETTSQQTAESRRPIGQTECAQAVPEQSLIAGDHGLACTLDCFDHAAYLYAGATD